MTRMLRKMLLTALFLPLLPIIGVPDGDPPPDGGGDPPPDPPPDGGGDPPPDPPPDAQEIVELKRKLEDAAKAQKAAEAALDLERKAHTQLKRTTKTEAELLEDQRKEMEENAKKYQRMMAGAKAKNILAGTGMSEDEYSPILELITSEDEDRTESIATEIKAMLEAQARRIEKSIREKVLKETPPPPTGGNGSFGTAYDKRVEAALGLLE